MHTSAIFGQGQRATRMQEPSFITPCSIFTASKEPARHSIFPHKRTVLATGPEPAESKKAQDSNIGDDLSEYVSVDALSAGDKSPAA